METAQIDKREHIIGTALEVFRRFGYNKTSIADIANEAHLGKGTIYYYFDSKEDIYVEILRSQAETLMQQIVTVIDEASDIKEKIRLYIIRPIELLAVDAPLLLEVFSSADDDFLRKIQAFKKRYHDKAIRDFQSLIETGQKLGQIRSDLNASTVTKVLHSWLHFWMNNISCKKTDFIFTPEGLEKLNKEYELLVDLLLNGLLVKEAK